MYNNQTQNSSDLRNQWLSSQAGMREWQLGTRQPFTVPQHSPDLLKRLPKVYGKSIVAVNKDERDVIHSFMLENGSILGYSEVIQAGFDGALQGLRVQNNQLGDAVIRSVPDGFTDNNLDNLPTFH